MAVCPQCGSPQVDGAAFCDQCGAALAPVQPAAEGMCPNCGARLDPESNFCDICGARIHAASFPVETPSTASVPTQRLAPELEAVSPSIGIPGWLAVQGSNDTLTFPPGKTEAVVGREDAASDAFPDIDLSPYGGEQGGVSRRHARILARAGGPFIEDLHSTNGTFVNQQRLVPQAPHPLNDGDRIRLGKIVLVFRR